jgi:hypothetical protein
VPGVGPLWGPQLRWLAPPCDPGLGAHGFLTLERFRRPRPAASPELVAAAERAASPAGLLGRRLPCLQASYTPLASSTSTGTISRTDLTKHY